MRASVYRHPKLFSFLCLLRQIKAVGLGGLFSRKKERGEPFPHSLSIVAIVKNEGSYLKEWLDYHRMLGVTHFLIYDNDSTDDTSEVLRPYVQAGVVEYISWPGKVMQVKAYTDALHRLRHLSRWVAFIDLDEFIVPSDENQTIVEIVEEIMSQNPRAGGLAVAWLMFGSSHHEQRPAGLVLENYLYRAEESFMLNIKTIGNPRLMHSFASPHYPFYYGLRCNVNENGRKVRTPFDYAKSTKKIHINHYFTKSKAECMAKIAKGIATVGTPRTEAIFDERDRNDIYDDSMLRYVRRMKEFC